MANVITGSPWVLDTAGAGLIWGDKVKITEIEWMNHNGGADAAELQDRANRTVARFDAGGSTVPQSILPGEFFWVDGLRLTTLNSGKVYVYIR